MPKKDPVPNEHAQKGPGPKWSKGQKRPGPNCANCAKGEKKV